MGSAVPNPSQLLCLLADNKMSLCRLCQLETSLEPLLSSMCLCKGSIGAVHLSCLERSLEGKIGESYKCATCNYKFKTSNHWKPLGEWSSPINICPRCRWPLWFVFLSIPLWIVWLFCLLYFSPNWLYVFAIVGIMFGAPIALAVFVITCLSAGALVLTWMQSNTEKMIKIEVVGEEIGKEKETV